VISARGLGDGTAQPRLAEHRHQARLAGEQPVEGGKALGRLPEEVAAQGQDQVQPGRRIARGRDQVCMISRRDPIPRCRRSRNTVVAVFPKTDLCWLGIRTGE
jgi:hypothetical protein